MNRFRNSVVFWALIPVKEAELVMRVSVNGCLKVSMIGKKPRIILFIIIPLSESDQICL